MKKKYKKTKFTAHLAMTPKTKVRFERLRLKVQSALDKNLSQEKFLNYMMDLLSVEKENDGIQSKDSSDN